MRIELTVRHAGQACDVAITSPGPVALAVLRPALARAAGASAGDALWSGERPLAGAALLGDATLRTGAVLSFGGPHRGRPQPGVLALHQVGGPDAGRVLPVGRGRLVIGRGDECDLVLADVDVSRRHAVIDVSASGIVLTDAGSTNGTTVDGRAVTDPGVPLRPGQLVRVGDSSLTLAGPTQTPASLSALSDGTLRMLRSPRQSARPADIEIEVPVRASATRPRGVQWVAALLPALAGGAIAWATRSPQFLLFALLSPVMMLSSSVGDRLHWRKSRRQDAATFARRHAAARHQIVEALLAETAARRAQAPDPAAVLRLAALPGSRLWERRRTDPDLLAARLGTADLPSTARTREGAATAPAGVVSAVPYTVDLRDGPLGVAGPRDVAVGVARSVIGQLAALTSPADVAIAMLLSTDVAQEWRWARWLPHLGGRVATHETEHGALVAELGALVDQRLAGRQLAPAGWTGPWLVVVVDSASRLADVTGLAALLARGHGVGVTAVCVDGASGALPTGCATVAQTSGETGSRARVRHAAGTDPYDVLVDAVSSGWAECLARQVAPLIDAGEDGSAALPDACGLFDCLGIDAPPVTDSDEAGGGSVNAGGDTVVAQLRRRWRRGTDGAATVIGMSADGPLRLDLAADGPHALVAGTTGAGKSELLQTLVAGLAASHPPRDVTFLLIDYKGGAAFGDCARLPHAAGLVTDLDPYLTTRALRSLHSELRRREKLLADAGVPDLAAYRAQGSEPLARMLIVVDEFATLVDELPDFVHGLVGVAQRGRSLGVHLVLATQRPGGAVSPEIRANTGMRIALRVTDPGESSDVIGSPHAATIERSRPGRAYLHTGAGLTCFQTAHAGAPAARAVGPTIDALDEWRRPVHTDAAGAGVSELDRLVTAARQAADLEQDPPAGSPWLAPLPEHLPRRVLPAPTRPDDIVWGLADLPDEQQQVGVGVDLAAGSSLLVAGVARAGRSMLAASVLVGAAERYGPDRLTCYVVDTGGGLRPFAGLPHVATLLGPDETANAATVLRRLDRVCSEAAARAVDARGDVAAPTLLVVDGWDRLAASLPDSDAIECAELLANVLRAGPAAGLTTIVTGDRSVLAPRFAASFGSRLLLRMSDRNDYGLAGISPRDVPRAMPPGRGLRGADGAVVQVAHAGSEANASALAQEVTRLATHWRARGLNPRADAIRVRPLPPVVRLGELSREPAPGDSRLALGVGGDHAEPVRIDPFAGAGRLLVAGPPRSGRSTVLRVLLTQAMDAAVPTVIAASARSPLGTLAKEWALRVIDPDDGPDAVGPVPDSRTLLLVDDCEAFVDAPAGEALGAWIGSHTAPLAAVVSGRADDLATSYRGIGAQVRRSNCGLLLRPGAVDGEILGVRLPRRPSCGPPGRGVLIGDPAWGTAFDAGEPVPIQVAHP